MIPLQILFECRSKVYRSGKDAAGEHVNTVVCTGNLRLLKQKEEKATDVRQLVCLLDGGACATAPLLLPSDTTPVHCILPQCIYYPSTSTQGIAVYTHCYPRTTTSVYCIFALYHPSVLYYLTYYDYSITLYSFSTLPSQCIVLYYLPYYYPSVSTTQYIVVYTHYYHPNIYS